MFLYGQNLMVPVFAQRNTHSIAWNILIADRGALLGYDDCPPLISVQGLTSPSPLPVRLS